MIRASIRRAARLALSAAIALASFGSVASVAFAEEDEGGSRPAAPDAPKAPGVPVFHAGIEAASEAARGSGALVLVVFGSQGCDACKGLERDVLDSDGFREKAGALHVVRSDVDVAPETGREFGVGAVPDLVLMTGIGKIVARRRGGMTLADFAAWVERARRLEAEGLWLGTAPADGDPDDAGDPRGPRADVLVRRLGSVLPGERARARRDLVLRGRAAVDALVSAAADPYLGTRVGVRETLSRMLAEEAPLVDPWAPGEERKRSAAALSKWWAESGELRPAGAEEGGEGGKSLARAARGAVAGVISGGPPARTAGMTELVGIGHGALPAIREGIARALRAQDDAAVSALQEARWAILVPYGIERKSPGIRMSLARGTGPERRRRTNELRAAGAAAIPALAELVDDPDNLVREAALHALSGVSGAGALDAMATLLKAEDANLRMTAAQSLGRTKNAAAAGHIAKALDDPDEVVVCAAVAALEEVKAKDRTDDLVRCLEDERWRVRAAAAEAIGNLDMKEAKGALTKLLADRDAFVVKNALEALKELRASLSYGDLSPVMKRLPGVASIALEILLREDSKKTLATAESTYDDSGAETRVAVFERLAELRNYSNTKDDYWKPLLEKAVASESADIRLGAAKVVENRSSAVASDFVGRLLGDQDAEVRRAAAAAVLRVVAHDLGATRRRGPVSVVTAGGAGKEPADTRTETTKGEKGKEEGEKAEATEEEAKEAEAKEDEKTKEEKVELSPGERILAKHASWHELLVGRAPAKPPLAMAYAIYVTGDGKSDLPVLEGTLALADLSRDFGGAVRDAGWPLVAKRLPWPEGEPFLEKACAIPFMHARLLEQAGAASKAVRGYVLDAARIEGSLEAAEKRDLESLLRSLLEGPAQSAASLRVESESASALLERLATSKKPVLRAAAAFARGSRGDEGSLGPVELATKDGDADVRAVAVGAIARRFETQEEREARLAPFLDDPSATVVRTAAVGLLLPEVREDASLGYFLEHFQYRDEVSVYVSSSRTGSDDRPLVAIRREPGFLGPLRERLASVAAARAKAKEAEEHIDMLTPVALLLAQYGDASGLKELADAWSKQKDADVPDAVIAAIALTRSADYMELLRRAAATADSSWEVRKLLKAVRGMGGAEARQMRRDLNKRVRDLGTN